MVPRVRIFTDVEEAISALGELTGQSVREDVTARIFQRFCVGKQDSTGGCLPKRPRRAMLEAGGEAMDAQKTGALIAQARRERGLTQKELSQALHVSAQAVSKWERGLNFPDLSLLEPLGDCLGLTVSELLSGQRGGEPREDLLLDSLRLLMSQAGRKLRRWRSLAQVCLGVLLALALGAGFWFVKNHTELLLQTDTEITPQELSNREYLAAEAAGNSSVYLFDLAVADGARHYQVQMELWTQEGLVRTWPAAEAYDPTAPRHQMLGFSYQKGEEQSTMELVVSTDLGTWQTTLEGVPDLNLGHLMSVLDERCEADPEHGVVLACWALAAEGGVTLKPDGGQTIIWSTPGWTGAVEKPRVLEGERFLLLRLTIS